MLRLKQPARYELPQIFTVYSMTCLGNMVKDLSYHSTVLPDAGSAEGKP
jgi:hypothetical protein